MFTFPVSMKRIDFFLRSILDLTKKGEHFLNPVNYDSEVIDFFKKTKGLVEIEGSNDLGITRELKTLSVNKFYEVK